MTSSWSFLSTYFSIFEQEFPEIQKCARVRLNTRRCYRSFIELEFCRGFLRILKYQGGTRWRSLLRHCATSRKVAGSIPDGVIVIFHRHNPSGRTMALGLTHPVTEFSTRNISWWVKAAGAYGWQPYQLHAPIVLKSGNLNLLEPSGPVQACNGIALPIIQSNSLTFWRRNYFFNFSTSCI